MHIKFTCLLEIVGINYWNLRECEVVGLEFTFSLP
jgi:hypothetical protein